LNKDAASTNVPIVVTANGLLQRGADNTFAFAQDANFWYLTGIDEPDIILVMDGDQEYLIVPVRSASRQAFDGAVNHQPLAKRSEIKDVYDDQAGWEKLKARMHQVKRVATVNVPPAYVEQHGIYTNPARATMIERLKATKTDLEVLSLNQQIAQLRMVKQAQELAAIQAAIDITVKTIKETTKAAKLRSYSHEYQLEAELTHGFRRRGAAGHAFDPIVASGGRACTLHNVANSGNFAKDELVIVDVGAEVEHYAADITRTFSLGRPSRRQQAVHAAVLAVQKLAFSLLKPGVLIKDYELQIEHAMGQQLIELGLIKAVDHQSIRKYYPHSTSHFLGLNVHDVGDYKTPLAPGMVLTVEPGIYIHKEGIGVRIEDDVLITDKGLKILTDKLPRALN